MTRMRFALVCCALLTAWLLGNAQPCSGAQTSTEEAIKAKLTATVHLRMGTTTVSALTATLSQQTGLAVQAAEYLQKRTLMVQLDGVTARSALDALCELNDWTWRVEGSNGLVLERRHLSLLASAAAIPRKMQAAFPRDMRDYLGIKKPLPNLRKVDNEYLMQTQQQANQRRGGQAKMNALIQQEQAALFSELETKLIDKAELPFAQLTPPQQHRLLLIALFQAMQDTSYFLLHGDGYPYVNDMAGSDIELNSGVTLLVGKHIQDGANQNFIGFGITLQQQPK